MEEGERAQQEGTTASSYTPATSSSTSNGKPPGRVEKVTSPTERLNSSGGDGFAGIAAKMLSAKVKVKGNVKAGKSEPRNNKQNGCDDDLPLGSEAHSLSLEPATDYNSKYPVTDDERSAWSKAISQNIMGWQSFSSDVSNHTSASSASLEQLLNDRQVDPEEMLLNLGFGGESRHMMPILARVPDRFLNHPSRAYGIAPPSLSDDLPEEVTTDSTDGALPGPDKAPVSAPTATIASQPKRRTGIWTLARTLSLLRLKSPPTRGHISPSSNCNGAQPHPGHPISILHPANQKYLASRGFYEKQGWPKGSFAEPEEDISITARGKLEANNNSAESRRKIFQKTKSRHNWSMCDSDENPFSPGGEWVTKSVDDSRSPGDNTGQDDSLGHGTYFSTTESSTDSLDTPNLETERAFENIRREFHESRRREYSSSDDLFMPMRRKRISSEVTDINENMLADQELHLLNTQGSSTNYFVSPASSRQTTVEKAPTIADHSFSVSFLDDADNDSQSHLQEHSKASSLANKSVHVGHMHGEGIGDVRIIISSSESNSGQRRPHFVSGEDSQNVKSDTLMVENAHTASSDSGSSSSATVVGGSYLMLASDEAGLRRLSESENSVTDKDSISRSNSPYIFSHDEAAAKQMTSNSCQTTDTDFIMAAAVAASHQVNVNTQTISNRTALHVHIKGSGVSDHTADNKKREYACLEQSPKVQLSTLPPTISHLELMRRLQHSQNDLSRMGSVQSDSSGFGDADPVMESAAVESDNVKQLTSLGSSNESCRTQASSSVTAVPSKQNREEIATQTSLDSSQVKTSRDVTVEVRPGFDYVKESPKLDDQSSRYVTMCYIPTVSSKFGHSHELRHRGGAASGDEDHNEDNSAPASRARSGSEPRHTVLLHRDDHDYARPRLNTTPRSEFITSGSTAHLYSHGYDGQEFHQSIYETPGLRNHGQRFHQSVSQYDKPSLRYDGLHEGGRFSHRDGHDNNTEYISKQGYIQKQSGSSSWYSRSPGERLERDTSRSARKYTSQIDLYANEGGFSRKQVLPANSPVPSPRRHSDEGILESRNTTPLSVELALARSSGTKAALPPHSPYTGTKPVITAASFNTTAPSLNNSSKFASRISGSDIHDSIAVETPAHYKTDAGFHYPPLAGNISGLQPGFRPPAGTRGQTFHSTTRQRSCDILDDDEDKLTESMHSRLSDDLDFCSQVPENISDISMQSLPEGGTKSGLLDAQKLARLISQPVHFM
ncbi:unnamed protein product, partial [Candidula unifasciata]